MKLISAPVHDHLLEAAPARVSAAQAGAVVAEHFGVSGTLQRLAGERDLNFRLEMADGGKRLLKFSNPLEDPQVLDFQTGALLYVEHADPDLPVQRVHAAVSGAHQVWVEIDGQRMLVRLFSFCEGAPLHLVERQTQALRRNLGDTLARLDLALADYDHVAADHQLLWDMKYAARLRPLLQHIEDAEQCALAQRHLDRFEEQVLPHLPQLRSQVIHNDLNPNNVIVDGEQVRNILDFGDIVRAPLIHDLAVAVAYQLGTDDDVLAPALSFIEAYHRRNPLQVLEQRLLLDLVGTRLVMILGISAWRASLHPENRPYILRNAQRAGLSLRALDALSSEQAQARILSLCEQELVP